MRGRLVYMPFQAEPVVLNRRERRELEEISGSQALPAGFVVRAKILLLSSGRLVARGDRRQARHLHADGLALEEAFPQSRARRA